MSVPNGSSIANISNVTVLPPTSIPSPMICYQMVKIFQNFTSAERIFYGYALPCLVFFGIIANIINIAVLTDRRLGARTYVYLAFLAFTDLITLCLYFVDLLAKIHFVGHFWHEFFAVYIYLPIGSISTTSSLLLTVTFTVDRFIYVRDPKIRKGNMSSKSKLATRLISAGLILTSAIINLPRIFAMYLNTRTSCRSFRNYAKSAEGWFGIYSYIRLAMLNVGSIVLLAIFNLLLILLVHGSQVRSHRDSITSAGRSSQSSQQMSLSITLIAATILALSGEIPSTLLNRTSAAVLWGDASVLQEEPFRSLIMLAYTLLMVEYGGKFVTYFLLNKKFRSLLWTKLCPWRADRSDQMPMTEYERRSSRPQRMSTASAPLLAHNSGTGLSSKINGSNGAPVDTNPNTEPVHSPSQTMPPIEENEERPGIEICLEADSSSEIV